MLQRRLLSIILTSTAYGFTLIPAAQAAEVYSSEQTTQQIAQSTAFADGGSLSVNGVGQVNAPADQAVVVLTYYPNSYYSGDSSESSTSTQVQPSELKTIADALSGFGVLVNNVKAFADPSSPGSIRVRFIVNQPDQAKLEQIIAAANTAITKTNRYTSNGAAVGYTVKDCAAVESQARQAAMTDAQNRAEALAKAAGTQVGDVSSVSESVTWGSGYSSTCPTSNDPTAFDSYSLPLYDPSLPPVVKLVYSLSASYNMR